MTVIHPCRSMKQPTQAWWLYTGQLVFAVAYHFYLRSLLFTRLQFNFPAPKSLRTNLLPRAKSAALARDLRAIRASFSLLAELNTGPIQVLTTIFVPVRHGAATSG